MRLVADGDAGSERALLLPLCRALRIGRDGNVDLVDYRIDLGRGLPERLAGLAGDEVGELVLLLADDIGEAAQGLDADGERLRRPAGPGGAGGRAFRVGIADGAGPERTPRRRLGRKIGRASCRGSVCQSVLISEGAVPIN